MKKVFIFAFALLTVPIALFAHGDGASFEGVVGDYIVDIGYSTPEPRTEEVVSFDFQLRPNGSASGVETEFTDVWVRIESEDGELMLASGIHNAEFGGARLTYQFPESGTYTISARYEQNGESLADAEFPLTVTPQSGTHPIADSILFAFLGFIAGLAVAYGIVVLRKRR